MSTSITDARANQTVVTGSSSASSSSSRNTGNISVDTETFLTLLVAQLQYQDPLSPQTDTEFVSQLAQMTSLQELQSMSASFQNSQAYGMIGKVVCAEVTSESGTVDEYAGYVTSVYTKSGTTYVVISDSNTGSEYAVPFDTVTQVFDSGVFESGTDILEASSLVGRDVEGSVTDAEGKSTDYAGTVTRVYYKAADMVIYAVLDDGSEIPISNITSVGVAEASDESGEAESIIQEQVDQLLSEQTDGTEAGSEQASADDETN